MAERTRVWNTYIGHANKIGVDGTLTNITVTVPEDLKQVMKRLRHVNWSDVARRAFEDAVRREEQRVAAREMDQLRASSKSAGWSGAKEIRRWRDVSKSL